MACCASSLSVKPSWRRAARPEWRYPALVAVGLRLIGYRVQRIGGLYGEAAVFS